MSGGLTDRIGRGTTPNWAVSNKCEVISMSFGSPIGVQTPYTAAGFEVGQVLDFIGSVTGSADPKIVKKLRSIRGVSDVSDDHPVDIGPPGAIS